MSPNGGFFLFHVHFTFLHLIAFWSKEGATQGDPAAMAFYALATRPLMDVLAKIGKIIQSWYADDTAACGSLGELKDWWDKLCAIGPSYGFFIKSWNNVYIIIVTIS